MFRSCVIAARAGRAMQNELARFPETETGGLLLGYSGPDGITILEATDGGYRDTIHEPDCFEYDAAYEEHLCGVLSLLYDPPLTLVGVWHKHNDAHEVPFSRADEAIHRQLLENEWPCLSVLFEVTGCGEETDYRARVFLLAQDGKHRDVTALTHWETA